MTAPKPKLRWFQYSLRTLLVVMTLSAIACSWYAAKKQSEERQQEAVATIEKLHGGLHWTQPSGPAWLRNLLGDDYFRTVDAVDLGYRLDAVSDAELHQIAKGFPRIEVIDLSWTNVTDAGLENLKGLSQLQTLASSEPKSRTPH